jgi:hypothetical protein
MLSGNLALSNGNSVVTALSYPTSFFDDLSTVRNFYAHRSKGTAVKVRSIARKHIATRSIDHPSDLVNLVILGKTQTLVEEWLGDMRQVGFAICQ